MNLHVVTLGDLVADMVVPIAKLPVHAHEHQPARDIAIEAGGTGNFLFLAVRLGLKATALGTVGQDYYGEQVLEMLASEGINVEHVVAIPNSRTTVSIVLIDDDAHHVFVGMHGTGNPQPFNPVWGEIIGQAGALFTTGYAMNPTSTFSPQGIMTCLEIANSRNVPVFFDLGPAAFIINRADIEAAIAQTTVFLATHEEATAWTGIEDPAEAAAHFLTQNPSTVVIKLGADGCLIATKERQAHIPGFPVKVRDTAGAGDSFAAACVYGYLKGFSLEDMGALANAVGGLSVSKLGTGARLPQREEVAQLLRQNGHSILD